MSKVVTSVEVLSVRARGAAPDFRPVKDVILKRIVQFLKEKDVATLVRRGKRQWSIKGRYVKEGNFLGKENVG